MTNEEHAERHTKLHHSLDELLADYLTHGPGNPMPTETSVIQLLNWSAAQAKNPDHKEP